MSQEAADQRQHNCKNDAEQRGSGNAFSHSFFIFCATALAETDAETTCKTIDKTKDKINKKLEKMKKFRSCESCPVDKGNFDMV